MHCLLVLAIHSYNNEKYALRLVNMYQKWKIVYSNVSSFKDSKSSKLCIVVTVLSLLIYVQKFKE